LLSGHTSLRCVRQIAWRSQQLKISCLFTNREEFRIFRLKSGTMIDNISIQFVTDKAGKKEAVLIPIKEWEKLQKEIRELLEYHSLKDSLFTAFREIKGIKLGKLPKTSLSSFLNEC